MFFLTGTKGIFMTKIAAVKKTKTGRELYVVDVDGKGGHKVTNNGSIEPGEAKRLFEKGYRGSSAQSSPRQGLGLWMVARIMQMVGGRYEVRVDRESARIVVSLEFVRPIAPSKAE